MNTVLLIGSHPRHYYLAKKLYDAGFLQGLLVETRAAFMPAPPQGIPLLDKDNFIRHFTDRMNAERNAFGADGEESIFPAVPVLSVHPEELNHAATRAWLSSLGADTAISYGIHKVDEETLQALPKRAWNIHGGLSPWYRGNITLFWPFYFLKPNWAGMTIHQLTQRLDGGNIIHHSVPELARGDGIHDVACKAVKQAGEDLVRLLQMVEAGVEPVPVPQKSSGKLFTSTDWTPQHLRLIYNTFDNDIVDRYLDGELGHQAPPLVKAF